ncbi:hypothetical protein ACFE04_000736 [Oxalis oulophora]
MKRKSPHQYQVLENFYSDNKYPTHDEIDHCASSLGLTYKEVRGWFVEKRRRDKNKNGNFLPPRLLNKPPPITSDRNANAPRVSSLKKILEQPLPLTSFKNSSRVLKKVHDRISKRKKSMFVQKLLHPDYILAKIFRKDGPPLGVEFDTLPFQASKCFRKAPRSLQDSERVTKKRKVSNHTDVNGRAASKKHGIGKGLLTANLNERAATQKHGIGKGLLTANLNERAATKKHGIGKGFLTADINRRGAGQKHGIGKALMTVWRATNPGRGDIPGVEELACAPQKSAKRKPLVRKKTQKQLVSKMKERLIAKKLLEKKKTSLKKREVQSKKKEKEKQLPREKCNLSLECMPSQQCDDQYAMLADDEDLELREIQAGPNPVSCSDHCSMNGQLGCPLCKDLLPKFPPNTVKMKQPFGIHPWDSSPETIKKLFKVFHFLYTHSVTVDVCSFTLDEFAQAFHDKDSLLLGKIHVSLLKLLLSDIETELKSGILRNSSISCKFLALLHTVESEEFILEFWKKSLNSLTWTEILHQVLVSAGFGSKKGTMQRGALSKEMDLMSRYGLRLGTLKGELFRLLLEHGSNGLKVTDLAKSYRVFKLNLASSTEELEGLICSALSSDITLFEKISQSAYRLRISAREADDIQSDDSGSVDYHSGDDTSCSSSDDSECDSENSNTRKLTLWKKRRSKNKKMVVYNEIDESHPGEVWLLGLMEGEYSDLSIEQMLSALVALVDLLSSGPSVRMEDPTKATVDCAPKLQHHGSGAKIKKASANQNNLSRSWVCDGQTQNAITSEVRPVDSSSIPLNIRSETFSSNKNHTKEGEIDDQHPMQSIFLGSDRRYNRYWLFLGPCNSYDPGHRRVYFESSEDGHWEVIDTEEALRILLSVLDDRGRREAVLIESLETREASLFEQMSKRVIQIGHSSQPDRSQSSSPVSDVDNLSLSETTVDPALGGAIVLEVQKKGEEHECKLSRLQELDKWIWNDFYTGLNAVKYSKKSYLETLARCEKCHDLFWRDEKHCKICHTTFELDFDLEERFTIHSATCRKRGDHECSKYKMLPSNLQSLKAAIHAVELVMPEDALLGAWRKSAHRLWIKRLRRTSSLAELLQVLADFVAAIKEDWLYECNDSQSTSTFMEEIIPGFPSMHHTSSAVALWLVKLDSWIAPYLEKVHSQRNQDIGHISTGKHASTPISLGSDIEFHEQQ